MRIGRLFFCGWTLLAVGATPGVAQGPRPTDNCHLSWYEHLTGSWHHFCDTVEMHRKRVNVWPEPFQGMDREQVHAPFRTMADNGWKLQNTLSDQLFDQETQELTYAGRLKLRYLMTQYPPHRRQVYVLEAARPEDTDKRVASVNRNLIEIAPEQACSVWTTKIEPPLTDGRRVVRQSQPKAGVPSPVTTTMSNTNFADPKTSSGNAGGSNMNSAGPGTSSASYGGSNGQ